MILYVPFEGVGTGIVIFNEPVGPGGINVVLVSDTPAIATVVTPLAVAEGDIAHEFAITWVDDGDCHITASYGGVDQVLDVTCLPEGGGAILYPFDAHGMGSTGGVAVITLTGGDMDREAHGTGGTAGGAEIVTGYGIVAHGEGATSGAAALVGIGVLLAHGEGGTGGYAEMTAYADIRERITWDAPICQSITWESNLSLTEPEL